MKHIPLTFVVFGILIASFSAVRVAVAAGVTDSNASNPAVTRSNETGYVRCGYNGIRTKNIVPGVPPTEADKCTVQDFFDTLQSILNDAIFIYIPAIATLLFAWAGFEMVTSGGDTSKVKSAKNRFKNVLIGTVIALSSFIIIRLVFDTIFGPDNYTSLIGK